VLSAEFLMGYFQLVWELLKLSLPFIASAITALITYKITKEKAFTDLYVSKKVEACEIFFDALLEFEQRKITQDEFASALFKAGIFSSKYSYEQMCMLFTIITAEQVDRIKFSRQAAALVKALRDDIDQCRELKYR